MHNSTQLRADSRSTEDLLCGVFYIVMPRTCRPSHYGLGNELDDCLTSAQWLYDLHTLQAVVSRVYTDARVPKKQWPVLVAPDVAQGTDDWQRDFLEGAVLG